MFIIIVRWCICCVRAGSSYRRWNERDARKRARFLASIIMGVSSLALWFECCLECSGVLYRYILVAKLLLRLLFVLVFYSHSYRSPLQNANDIVAPTETRFSYSLRYYGWLESFIFCFSISFSLTCIRSRLILLCIFLRQLCSKDGWNW